MVKNLGILLVIILLFGQADDHYIEWQQSRKLNWDDFQGPIDDESSYKAHTKSKLSVGWECDEGIFNFHAVAKFDKEVSWKADVLTDELLAHEQLHFDICELYARKARLRIQAFKNGCALSQEEVKAILKKNMADWEAYEELYDEESDHNRNREEQVRWENKVAAELEALSKYALK